MLQRGRWVARRAAALGLSLAVAAALLPLGGFRVAAQVDGAGSITVYNVACPPGYDGDDPYADCYDAPIAGAGFQVGLLDSEDEVISDGATDATGLITLSLADMTPGEVRLGQIVNGEYEEYIVACTKNGGNPVDFEYQPIQIDPGGDFWAIDLAVEPGDDVRCDWFDVPVGEDNGLASITIYTAVCPVGYAGDDFFGACYDTPGVDVPYLLTGPAFPETVTSSTGSDGFAAFEGIDETGVYDLQVDVPGDAADFVIFCSDEFGEPFATADSTEIGLVELDLTLDDDVKCDVYIIPENLQGETPTPAPTQAPATSTVGTLPGTGAGSAGGPGGPDWSLAAALAMLVVAGASLAVGRARYAASMVRVRR
jgi:hypothetical protein